MRPVRISMNAPGNSQWIPVDYTATWFGLAIGLIPSEDAATVSYNLQCTLDGPELDPTKNISSNIGVTIARAGAVATVTDLGPAGIGHGLTTGDSVIVMSSGSTQLDSQPSGNPPEFGAGQVGWTVASTPSPTTWTYACANAGPTTDSGNARVARFRVFNLISAGTTRQVNAYNIPIRAVRLNVATLTAGYIDMIVLQGVGAR